MLLCECAVDHLSCIISHGPVCSILFSGLSESKKERIGEAEELLQRYLQHGDMKEVTDSAGVKSHVNQPNFAEDKCCSASSHLKSAGFLNPRVIADEYHISKRFKDASKVNFGDFTTATNLIEMMKAINKCFFDAEAGVYAKGEDIIARLDQVRAAFSTPESGGVWTAQVDTAFKNAKPHILECLRLEEHIPPTLRDRQGKIVMTRGTNVVENLWRYQ